MSTATKATHTPGPWHIDQCFCGDGHDHSHYEICAPVPSGVNTNGFNYLVADTAARYCTNISEEEDQANARLIAAAPEMLEALELYHAAISAWRTTRRMPDYAEWVRFFDKGEAAIRKARGGE